MKLTCFFQGRTELSLAITQSSRHPSTDKKLLTGNIIVILLTAPYTRKMKALRDLGAVCFHRSIMRSSLVTVAVGTSLKPEGDAGQLLSRLTSSAAEASASAAISSHYITWLACCSRQNVLSFVIFLVSFLRTAHSDQATACESGSPAPSLPLCCPEAPRQVVAAGSQPHRTSSQRTLKWIKYALVDICLLFPVLTALFFFIAREFYGWCHFSPKRTDHQSFLLT